MLHFVKTDRNEGGGRSLAVHYLRIVAALMVVAYHICSQRIVPVTQAQGPAFVWLCFGVSIFFVISGYVMVISTSNERAGDRRTQPIAFLVKRIWRIAPLYWVMTLLWAAWRGDAEPSHLLSSLLFIPGAAPATGQFRSPVLDVGWSLNFEMAFYVLFAACLLLPRRGAIMLMTLLLCAAPLFAPMGKVAGYYGRAELLDFVAGMWIAHLRVRLPCWLLPVGFAMLVIMPALLPFRAVSVTMPSALILASALSFDRHLAGNRFLILLGDASSGIYLAHLFVLFALHDALGASVDAPLLFLLALTGSAGVGVAVHLLVERPLLSGRLWRRQRPIYRDHRLPQATYRRSIS